MNRYFKNCCEESEITGSVNIQSWFLLVQLLRGTPQSWSCHLRWSRRDKTSPSAARLSASHRQLWSWRSWPMGRNYTPPTAPSYWSMSQLETPGFIRSTWPTTSGTRWRSSASASEVSQTVCFLFRLKIKFWLYSDVFVRFTQREAPAVLPVSVLSSSQSCVLPLG